jgi:hypothetical protein
LEQSQSFFQLLVRRSQILQQFDFAIEVNDESFVPIFAHHLIQKAMAGAALLVENAALAHAGVDEETKGQRKVGIASEVVNGLRSTILAESEIIFGKVVDDFAVLIADSGEHIDDFDLDGDGCGGI